jgi:hypothetical protein
MSKPIRQIRIEGNIAYVPLTQGYEAVIDADDAPLVAGHNWFAIVERRPDQSIRCVYAMRRQTIGVGRQATILMHRVIAGLPDGLATDHRNGDGLDNRRENLRPATTAQNAQNQGIRSTNTTGVKGVSFHKGKGTWQAEIGHDGKRRHLGTFHSLESAAAAYAKASAELHGGFGRTK